ncbi:hypothetical protein [Dactylosporangium sp. NPDC051484]|uniref:hypothetical protein n=1 Tax=Dactylosporangium sp. NPDC051484 TaxID=3154942 RepID=UPI00344B8856
MIRPGAGRVATCAGSRRACRPETDDVLGEAGAILAAEIGHRFDNLHDALTIALAEAARPTPAQ